MACTAIGIITQLVSLLLLCFLVLGVFLVVMDRWIVSDYPSRYALWVVWAGIFGVGGLWWAGVAATFTGCFA